MVENRVAPISRKKLGPHPPGKKRTIRLAISHRETGWHHLVGIIEKQGDWGFSSYYLIEKEVEKFLAEAEINRVAPFSRDRIKVRLFIDKPIT